MFVVFSFGWLVYVFIVLILVVVGDGWLMLFLDYWVMVINVVSGYKCENKFWIVGCLLCVYEILFNDDIGFYIMVFKVIIIEVGKF